VSTCFRSTRKTTDHLSINGASTALVISDIPFGGPVGAVAWGCSMERSWSTRALSMGESELDLVVAGTADAILMVEAGARASPSRRCSTPGDGPRGDKGMRRAGRAAGAGGRESGNGCRALPPQMIEIVGEYSRCVSIRFSTRRTRHRETYVDELRSKTVFELGERFPSSRDPRKLFDRRSKDRVRRLVEEGVRMMGAAEGRAQHHGRGRRLPRTHGSGSSRAQTQALTIATLGSMSDSRSSTVSPRRR